MTDKKNDAGHSISDYLKASTRENTRKSYQSAIRHYDNWGGLLPATPDMLMRYVSEHAGQLAVSTLEHRLTAIAVWHKQQGFPDPTKTVMVKKILKGVREIHPHNTKQAAPLRVEDLAKIIKCIESSLKTASHAGNLRLLRNRALILLGFFRALRSDELCRIEVENVVVTSGHGLTIFLPRSKGDRYNKGRTLSVPLMKKLCPIAAYQDWVNAARITSGSVFTRISKAGSVSESAMAPASITPLLRSMLDSAGIENSKAYSSHSLRRGFATWVNREGWGVSELMKYVGWKDPVTAMKYVDLCLHGSFDKLALPS